MFGAILGDIVGSPYEFDHNNIKTKEFPLFSPASTFTDDTIMTLAVGEALMRAGTSAPDPVIRQEVIRSLRHYGRRYPHAGYGSRFAHWLRSPNPQPYHSFGNGSAMRISSVGWLCDSLPEVLRVARAATDVTHDHPEGIRGAQVTAAAIFLARTGHSKSAIRAMVQDMGYTLNRSCDEIRPGYYHQESCQATVPQALTAFLEGQDLEDVMRLAVSLGGDSDTLTAIAASIAEAYYGMSDSLRQEVYARLPRELAAILTQFESLTLPRTQIPPIPAPDPTP